MADHRCISERYAKIGAEIVGTEDALAHMLTQGQKRDLRSTD